MSDNALVVLNNDNTALQLGGVGLGAPIFKARPSWIELVHKSSRQENVQYGQFRVTATNEHLGNKIRVVLLGVPQLRREWYFDPKIFNKENRHCFSLDGVQPHPKASHPPALMCSTCSKGDINWTKWRETKNPNDLPPCNAYWHLMLALRDTQTPHLMDIKGKSYMPFKQAMEQQMQPLLAKLMANVKFENKKLGYALVTLQDKKTGAKWQEFQPLPGMTPETPAIPMPNIFDVSFDISSVSKDGGPFQMKFDGFALMKPEDKAEFGQLYLDIMTQKAEIQAQYDEQAEVDAAVVGPEPTKEHVPNASGEVLPPITI